MADNQGVGARPQADQALAVPAKPASGLDASRFDPSRDITPIDLVGKAMTGAYDYIKRPDDPPFEEVGSDYRIWAMATALVAVEPLIDALREIRSMRTPGANATVRRMAERAAITIEARSGETQSGSTEGESAGRDSDIAQGPSQ